MGTFLILALGFLMAFATVGCGGSPCQPGFYLDGSGCTADGAILDSGQVEDAGNQMSACAGCPCHDGEESCIQVSGDRYSKCEAGCNGVGEPYSTCANSCSDNENADMALCSTNYQDCMLHPACGC